MTGKEAKAQMQIRNWEAMIQERERRGLTIREYCKESGIAPQTYYNRQNKVRDRIAGMITEEQTDEIAAQRLAPIGSGKIAPKGWAIPIIGERIPVGTINSGVIELQISGIKISVDKQSDLQLLADVCRVVKAL